MCNALKRLWSEPVHSLFSLSPIRPSNVNDDVVETGSAMSLESVCESNLGINAAILHGNFRARNKITLHESVIKY